MNLPQNDSDQTPLWHSVPTEGGEVELPSTGLGIRRYRLERVLGEGTFGRVHLAKQAVLGRKVAVKILHRRHGSRKQEIRAFLNEALILADLNHPGIVPVYDAGWTDDGFFYIVSRYVEGGDLSALLTRRRPALEESVQIVTAIAEALHYAHTRGLVHRDLKPANILIDPPGKPLLIDFGVALRDKDFGRGSGLVGTPSYMSPEQARGEGNRVDGRSDIFSLGIVLYELLTGMPLFRGRTQQEIMEQVKNTDVRSPIEINPDIPDALSSVCQRALAKRASERYSSAEELALALMEWLRRSPKNQPPFGIAGSGGTSSDSPSISSTLGFPQFPTVSDHIPAGSHNARIIPKGLHPYQAEDASFFLDMLPGPRNVERIPQCVEFWRARIEPETGKECFRVGVLFGPSGSGKTSLIRAGVVPVLSHRIIVVQVETTANGTEAALRKLLQSRCPELSERAGLTSAFSAARKGWTLPPGSKLLVVIDQFERWLRGRRATEETELIRALQHCDGEHSQALLVVRDDSWSVTSRFMRDVGDRIVEGENTAAVGPFDQRHSRTILAAFGRAYGTLPEGQATLSEDQEKFLDGAISMLDRGNQILPIRLALLAEMVKSRPWVPLTLEGFGAFSDVTRAFLEAAFDPETAPPENRLHRGAACSVLKSLLPDQGSDSGGRSRSLDELLLASGCSSRPLRFETLMRILRDQLGLITCPEMEAVAARNTSKTGSESHYRLTNDFLAEPLRDWLTREEEQPRQCDISPFTAEPKPVGPVGSPNRLLDINTATKKELMKLPGIGTKVAQRIIRGRPYRTITDLLMFRASGKKV